MPGFSRGAGGLEEFVSDILVHWKRKLESSLASNVKTSEKQWERP